jgi:hypothetical protein
MAGRSNPDKFIDAMQKLSDKIKKDPASKLQTR